MRIEEGCSHSLKEDQPYMEVDDEATASLNEMEHDPGLNSFISPNSVPSEEDESQTNSTSSDQEQREDLPEVAAPASSRLETNNYSSPMMLLVINLMTPVSESALNPSSNEDLDEIFEECIEDLGFEEDMEGSPPPDEN